MRLGTFSVLLATAALLGHGYLYRRLVRKLARGVWVRAGLLALFASMTGLILFRRPLDAALGPALSATTQKWSYAWLAVLVCMSIAVAVGDVLLVAYFLQGKWLALRQGRHVEGQAPAPDRSPVDPGRRRLIQQGIHWGALIGGGATTAYGVLRAFAAPEVSRVAVRLPRLPAQLDGLTLVQLSDIHVGPFIDAGFLAQLVDVANAERPDAVVITGDLVDGSVRALGPAVSTLARLKSRYGTFFVTGNHEYYSGDEAWCRYLARLGITVLRNRRVSLGDTARIDLVGVDDWRGSGPRGRRYDLDTALRGRDPERAAVLLAHQPTNFEQAAARGLGLQLSGHTHGGQLFPMTAAVEAHWQYSRGLYQHADSHIYVSRGCGFWGPPARVGSPPEVVALHLTV